MPIASFILGLALLLAAAAYVVQPFMRTARPAWRRRGAAEAVSAPAANHQDTLRAIRDLDFDYRTGKIAEDDYSSARERLLLEAAGQLQAEPAASAGGEADAQIEAAVQAQRHAHPAGGADARIEAAVQARRQKNGAGSAGACPQCHTPAVAGDRFCARCGARLSVQPEAAV